MATSKEERQPKNPRLETNSLLRICELPDEILVCILSLLETKSAVATSLLSRRWRYLWTSITNLRFNEEDMFRERSEFISFVDRALNLRNGSHLVSFSLNCELLGDASRINTWISMAIQCNVEDLGLYLPDPEPSYLLPSCIFGCQSLVKLELVVYFLTLTVPASVICFPHLKKLVLSWITFADDESTEKLLSSPLLEELVVDSCYWENIKSISVCAPKLQVLNIFDGADNGHKDCKVCFIGNNLKSFLYSGDLINEYRIRASSTMQLSKAEINMHKRVSEGASALNCYKILKGLSRTQNLALSDHFLEGLEFFPELFDTIPLFECLTQLNLRVYEEAIDIDNEVLMKIFERCPHLELLKIQKPSHTSGGSQLSPMPSCFRTNLKKIAVDYYVPGDDQDYAISVLLNSATVLEEMLIYCIRDRINGFYEGSPKIRELQDGLNQLPRISKDCIISVRI